MLLRVSIILLTQFFCATVFASASCKDFSFAKHKYSIDITHGTAVVTKDGTEIFRKTAIDNIEGGAIYKDFNFDGYVDLAILRDTGIERYFDIYLFEENTGKFQINNELSALACPDVDEKKKLVLSTCNHASACEMWQDWFQYNHGKLQLVRRDGTTCDPISGQGFKYFEVYRDGKIVNQKTSPLKQY